MILAIQQLERRPGLDSRAVDAFVRNHTFPLIEGLQVTFVWRGHADAVQVVTKDEGKDKLAKLKAMLNRGNEEPSVEKMKFI